MLPETALLTVSPSNRSPLAEQAGELVRAAAERSRPPRWQESVGSRLFRLLSPRIPRQATPTPPASLAPFEELHAHRTAGPDTLAATWYSAATTVASDRPRGAVLLLHPWSAWGQAYFHRHARIESLRAAGYHALTVDLGGFGGSGRANGFFDRDVEDALALLRRRAPGLPLHVWGVSSGGYWAHPLLARAEGVSGVMFEDVSPHLLEWSWRMAPWGRPFYLFFRFALPAAYRFLDARRHASCLKARTVAYVSGERDPGIRPEDTEELASRAGAPFWIIPRAGHLGAIKTAGDEVIEIALATFEQAVERPKR
jgi:pimeloyl-ACP methyl ester carboxylesterase